MTKVEYIRASHRQTNRKLRECLDGGCRKLRGKNRVLGWLWRIVAWIVLGMVYLVSWLAFVVTLFRDVKFTLHYMECEIGDLPPAEARQYILAKQQEYTRRLSYGSISAKGQKRIDKTFEYLFAKYPAPVEDPLPDLAAERHAQVIGNITEVKAVMVGVVGEFDRKNREDAELWGQEEERHSQMLNNIAEVKTAVDSVVTYTDLKGREDAERQKREAEQLAAAGKRRECHLSRSGFEHNPEDFSPKLSDKQISVLTKHMNEIGVFKRYVTAEEITRLLLCEHTGPLQTTHNKIIALLLEKLSDQGLITPKWQQVAYHKQCFTSKHGKPLTAKDLSAAKQMADFIADRKYEMITDSIDAVKEAR